MLNNATKVNNQYVISDDILSSFHKLIGINSNIIVVMHVPPGSRSFPVYIENNKKFLNILANNRKKVQVP